ncbi:amidohydrolase family protein [Salinisphaera japonica]|uniref:Amidohydrolase n=1 Tax=Salinisphaera japonica YTM-1 TaxID=1209778 RepID=A0A423PJ51_9GAMM|nr:amidohydrolase family protein [Salinisphaera japonica]ROO25624.1 amidohydrolase [Salinisphaera japonica YTM-1]
MSTSIFAPRSEFDDIPLTDCHVHIGESDTNEIYYPHLALDEYRRLMAPAGITRACVFAPLRKDGYRQINARLRTAAADPRRSILVFARLASRDIPLTEPAPWLVRYKLHRHLTGFFHEQATPDDLVGFDGVKLLPHLDGCPSRDVLAAIDELGLPLLVHGGDFCSPRWIERHLIRHTRAPVIIAHLGSFPCAERHLKDAVAIAARHEQVYLDTSGAWHHEYLRYAVRRIPKKIIFGSDAPLMHPLVAWRHVSHAVADDITLEWIAHGAADEIFGCVDRSGGVS